MLETKIQHLRFNHSRWLLFDHQRQCAHTSPDNPSDYIAVCWLNHVCLECKRVQVAVPRGVPCSATGTNTFPPVTIGDPNRSRSSRVACNVTTGNDSCTWPMTYLSRVIIPVCAAIIVNAKCDNRLSSGAVNWKGQLSLSQSVGGHARCFRTPSVPPSAKRNVV